MGKKIAIYNDDGSMTDAFKQRFLYRPEPTPPPITRIECGGCGDVLPAAEAPCNRCESYYQEQYDADTTNPCVVCDRGPIPHGVCGSCDLLPLPPPTTVG